MNKLKYAMLTLGVILITVGAYRGEATIVLKKAIKICLECIGVG